MDFAADAVIDAIAPQTRAPSRAPTPDSDEPSFEDHLDAATAADAPQQSEAPTQPSDVTRASAGEDADTIASADPAVPDGTPAATQQQPAIAAPVIVQIAAAETPAPQTAQAAAPQQTTPVEAPVAPAAAKTDGAAKSAEPSTPNAPLPGPTQSAPAAPEQLAKASPATQDKAAPTTPPQSQPNAAGDNQAQTAPTASAQTAAQTATTASGGSVPPGNGAVTQTPADRTASTAAAAAHVETGRPEAGPREHAVIEPPSADDAPPPAVQGKAAAAKASPAAAPQQAAREPIAPLLQASLDAPSTQGAAPASAPSSPAAQSTQHATLDHHSTARAASAPAQVAREIVRRFDGGATRFELRLDPPDLGRVEVRLDVSRDHRVSAVIAADSPQALTELARHARELEQMLQSAGLELNDNGLSFDLRQGREGASEGSETGPARGDASPESVEQAQPTLARPIGYERWRGVRVDMMV